MAGVDGNAGQPCRPIARLVVGTIVLDDLEKDFLRHVVGVFGIAEEHQTQTTDPPVMLFVKHRGGG